MKGKKVGHSCKSCTAASSQSTWSIIPPCFFENRFLRFQGQNFKVVSISYRTSKKKDKRKYHFYSPSPNLPWEKRAETRLWSSIYSSSDSPSPSTFSSLKVSISTKEDSSEALWGTTPVKLHLLRVQCKLEVSEVVRCYPSLSGTNHFQ